jgi:superfamily II DNA or RNA helicase
MDISEEREIGMKSIHTHSIKLRDYQEDCIRQIFDKLRDNNRLILYAATGAGKSEIAAYLANDAMKDGFPVLMIARGRDLVGNLSERLDKYRIDHSVYMAGNIRLNKSKLIQICSSDTLKSRKDYPFLDRKCLVILDEQHKDYSEIIEIYKDKFIIGFTGTPFGNNNHLYDDYICPIEPYELKNLGVLVPEKIYCPHVIDTSSLKIVAGDFKRDQVEQLVTNGDIVGNVVQDYIDLGDSRPSVCFGVSVEHSKQLRDEFISKGISAAHCDANSSDDERKKARIDLESGKIKVLCNVDIFSVGWDCPMVSCIILARPTWSLIWYLQAVGRGLRSYPGKKDCIILDNAGNVYRHGLAYRPRTISMEKKESGKKARTGDLTIRTCKECFSIFETPAICCPYCGAEPVIREVKKVDGVLMEYSEGEEERRVRLITEAQNSFYKLQWVASSKGLSTQWIRDQISKKYGIETLKYIEPLLKIKKGR